MPRSPKINLEKVLASLNSPKCGYSIPPVEVRLLDFTTMECPECGEKFQPSAKSEKS
jgi:hypothetical protein